MKGFVMDNSTFSNRSSLGMCLWTRNVHLQITESFKSTIIATSIINSITALVAAVGNTLVISLFCKYPTLRKPSNILIISLCFSDALSGYIIQPLLVFRRISNLWNKQGCVARMMYIYGSFYCLMVSLGNVALISMDRCLAIHKPFLYQAKASKHKYITIVVSLWVLFALCIGLPHVANHSTKRVILIMSASTTAISLSAIAMSYSTIYITVQKQREQMKLQTALVQRTNVTFMIVIILIICYALNMILMFFRGIAGDNYMTLLTLDTWADTLVLVNSSINPFLYCLKMSDFKEALKKLLGYQRQKHSKIFTTSSSNSLDNTTL